MMLKVWGFVPILFGFWIFFVPATTGQRIKFKNRKPASTHSTPGGNVNLSAKIKAGKNKPAMTVQFQQKDPDGVEQSWQNGTKQGSKGKFQLSANFPSSSPGTWAWRIKVTLTNSGKTGTSSWRNVVVEGSDNDDGEGNDDGGNNDDGGGGDIAQVKAEILALTVSNVELKAKFLRLGFHDCVGGCDGCVDMTNVDNRGLLTPIDALAPVVAKYANDQTGLSRADIWALATVVGAESSQRRRDAIDFPFNYIGRVDCDSVDGKTGPSRTLPSPDLDGTAVLHFFSSQFSFSPRETVALMGAHSIGSLSQENSGFRGGNGWDRSNEVLDVGYYQGLIGGRSPNDSNNDLFNARNWRQQRVTNNDPLIPTRFEWVNNGGNNNPRTIMLNSDIALVRDLSSMNDDGSVGCRFRGRRACPAATQTFDHMVEFKFDLATWLQAFRDVLGKMLTHGYNAGTCNNPPCVLTPA